MMRLIPTRSGGVRPVRRHPCVAQEWIEYISPQDSFSINFPVQPEIRDIAYQSEYGVNLAGARLHLRRRQESLLGHRRRLLGTCSSCMRSGSKIAKRIRTPAATRLPMNCGGQSTSRCSISFRRARSSRITRSTTRMDRGTAAAAPPSGPIADVCRHSHAPEPPLHLRGDGAGRSAAAGVVSAVGHVD